MQVLLLQLDGSLPNLALMRLAAHHMSLGHDVTLRQTRTAASVEKRLGDDFGQVYASLLFEKTQPVAHHVRRVYPGAIIGGTGWDYMATLEVIGIGGIAPDYSIYPGFRQSIGFLQRGCRLSCSFCVVPEKEGKVQSVATVYDLWRGGDSPRELILLDNDFFGNPHWRDRIREMRDGRFKVCFCQGINARLLPEEGAEAIASVDYRNAAMKTRTLYTAWDNRDDEVVLFRGLRRLVKYGVRPDDITVYILIGYWANESEDDWNYRRAKLRDFGCRPYPMPYRREGSAKWFQTWVIGAYDKATNKNHVPWDEWKRVRGEPRRLGCRMPLPLFDHG